MAYFIQELVAEAIALDGNVLSLWFLSTRPGSKSETNWSTIMRLTNGEFRAERTSANLYDLVVVGTILHPRSLMNLRCIHRMTANTHPLAWRNLNVGRNWYKNIVRLTKITTSFRLLKFCIHWGSKVEMHVASGMIYGYGLKFVVLRSKADSRLLNSCSQKD